MLGQESPELKLYHCVLPEFLSLDHLDIDADTESTKTVFQSMLRESIVLIKTTWDTCYNTHSWDLQDKLK